MELRKSVEKDLNQIMTIINDAKLYFKNSKIDQWQNGYPNEESILDDIKNAKSHVLVENNKIVAIAYISFDGESDYEKIYEGKWIRNENFAVVHRVAVKNDLKGRGIAGKMFNEIEKICLKQNVHDIKIDTHRNNKSMQRFLEKQGFTRCGIVYLDGKDERIGFEKILNK